MWRYYYTIARNIFRLPEAIKTMKDILKAKRLDKQNNRQAMRIINEVAKEVEKNIK